MPSPLDGFLDFTPYVQIPSRDAGVMPFTPLFGTQEYLHACLCEGLAEGVHDFICLKGGRQIGGTTYCDALCLWYLQKHAGMVGMYVSDDDENRDYRRDIVVGMLDTLPKSHRQPTRMNNRFQLAWLDNRATGYRGSRLIFGAAGKRSGSNLGRSKGINFNINDEVGSWVDQAAHSALRASRSKQHPLRLYIDVSTARGVGSVFHDIWKTAEKAVAQRAIFLAWWRHRGYALNPDDPSPDKRALWKRYASAPPTREENQWALEVTRRYGVKITRGQLAWYRWQLVEEFMGDEQMLAQEYGVLPEECFQAFGDKFISPVAVRRMRQALLDVPEPTRWRYEWADVITEAECVRVEDAKAPMRVWSEPVKEGAYVVAAHPWGSSSANARQFVVQVWRGYPDRLIQVAEYVASEGAMYQFAWVCLNFCGA